MPDGKWFFIINPTAGGGQVKRNWQSIETRLKKENVGYEFRFTTAPNDATVFAKKALTEGYHKFISVGGDGTNHEIVNGLFDSNDKIPENVKLGFFPSGSGNDFLRSLNISNDIDKAFNRLHVKKTIAIDIGKLTFTKNGQRNSEYLISVAGTGFTADVTKTANDHFKFLGKSCYFVAVFPNLFTFKNVELNINVDGKEFKRKSCMTVVANSSFFGGGMKIAPNASLQDGLFEILLFREFNLLELLFNFPKVFKGDHISHSKVEVSRGKHILISSAKPQNILADGEIVGETPVEFQMLPNVLNVCV